MNTNNLILTPTTKMSRAEWLAFRQPLTHIKEEIFRSWIHPGEEVPWTATEDFYNDLKNYFHNSIDWKNATFPILGASEVSTIMGLNPYKSIIELFFEKTGAKPTFDEDNIAMFWGRELEEQIAQKWQYFDGSAEGMIANFASDNIIRKCRRANAYIQNKNFPWLFCSLDRIINKGTTGKEGSLECKTISGFSANMWENGIPPMYVGQLQVQMKICEFDFGEIAILKDGRYFEVLPFDIHPGICQRIVDESKKFFDMVKAGCEQFLLWTYCPNDELKQDHYAKLEQLAPEPDGSDAYKAYLSQAYSDKGFEITGTAVELELAKQYKHHATKIKVYEADQQECSNKLKAFMKDASTLSFGQDGSCTWKTDKGGKRTFRVNVREESSVPEFFGVKPEETVEAKVLEHNKEEKKSKKKKSPESLM